MWVCSLNPSLLENGGTLCDLASDALRQIAEGLIYTLGRWLNTGGKLSLLHDIMKNI